MPWAAAWKRPVFLAAVSPPAPTPALDAGASGVIAGTRFLLTHEADANREYQRRVIHADKTIETNLFGFSWPLRHRVVPNAATRRWCDDDGKASALPTALNAASRPLSVPGCFDTGALMRLQSTARPLFTPLPPVAGMPDSWVDRAVCRRNGVADRRTHLGRAGGQGPQPPLNAPAASVPTRGRNRPAAGSGRHE